MGLRDYRMGNIFSSSPQAPRKRQIGFGGPPSEMQEAGASGVRFQAPEITIPDVNEDDSSRYYRMIQDIRNEQTPGMTAYKTALQGMPQEEEYRPNVMTRIGAGLSGLAAGYKDPAEGVTTAMALNREPYRRAMEDYKNELSGLEEQAGMEQEDREARMEAIRDASRLGLDYKKFEQQGEHYRALEGTAAANARANVMRAEATARPTYSLQTTQGGFLAVNSKDPSDTKMIAARTPQDAAQEIARMNAATSRMQANTSAGNLAQRKEEFGVNSALAGTRIGQAQQRIDQADEEDPATPAAQTSARELAMDKLMNHPKFGKFVSTKDKPVSRDDFTDQQWSTFEAALRALEEEILAGGGF